MKSESVNPLDLFDKPVRYVVPLFQRPYVWEKERQWRPLWEDIRRTAEGFDGLVASGKAPEKALAEARTHFLGAVVVQAVSGSAKYIPERFVIDGQQRLTTLQIVIDAARLVLEREGLDQAASILVGLVRNEEKYWSTPDHEFKVWPTNLDRSTYRALMTQAEREPTDPAERVQGRLVDGHEFFAKEIRDWAQSAADASSRERMLDSLGATLRHLLEIVEITLGETDNAQVIFETLNDRGTPLQASDLVKNYLFLELEAEGKDSESLYETHWAPFDTDPWRQKVSQGRLYRPRVDLFLQHWLILRTLDDVVATDIFTTFRTHVQSRGKDATEVLVDLSKSGAAWRGLEDAEPTSRLGTFVYRQRAMQADSLGPVLLWLYDPSSPTPEAQRNAALSALESWLVRRMVCRLTTKDYNSLYVELLTNLRDVEPAHRGTSVESFLLGQTANSRYWPSDPEVAHVLSTLPIYKSLTRGRLRMILEAIEDFLRGNRTEERVTKSLTIEHVMPQSWQDHWMIPADVIDEDDFKATRDAKIQTLGNLTLLTQSLNSGISNGPWADKRKGIEDYGVLRLSADLKTAITWDENLIAARTSELAGVICNIWPRPKQK
jgi:hypothetical protein